eukprot:c0_g1_i1.p1 GENE.c0_g1_i1~~c0_g1_i1.p1  ORF type:complete len:799 (-),score=248.57 c0_g1_i1:24-2354(-)
MGEVDVAHLTSKQIEAQRQRVHRKLVRLIGQAWRHYEMIRDGDRVMVGLSGGKDSLSMLDALVRLKQKSPVKFEIGVCTVDPMTPAFNPHPLKQYVREVYKLPYYFESVPIIDQAAIHMDKRISICSYCSRMKRGVLYSTCRREGYNVLALGQHLDDLAESFVMSAFHNGKLRTMKAHYLNEDGDVRIIRPLVYAREHITRLYAQLSSFPVINENCPGCFTAPQERAHIKTLLAGEEERTPTLFQNILKTMRPLMEHDLGDIETVDMVHSHAKKYQNRTVHKAKGMATSSQMALITATLRPQRSQKSDEIPPSDRHTLFLSTHTTKDISISGLRIASSISATLGGVRVGDEYDLTIRDESGKNVGVRGYVTECSDSSFEIVGIGVESLQRGMLAVEAVLREEGNANASKVTGVFNSVIGSVPSPVNVINVTRSNNILSFSCDCKSDSMFPILKYLCYVAEAAEPISFTSSAQPIVLDHIPNDRMFDLRIIAINEIGKSIESVIRIFPECSAMIELHLESLSKATFSNEKKTQLCEILKTVDDCNLKDIEIVSVMDSYSPSGKILGVGVQVELGLTCLSDGAECVSKMQQKLASNTCAIVQAITSDSVLNVPFVRFFSTVELVEFGRKGTLQVEQITIEDVSQSQVLASTKQNIRLILTVGDQSEVGNAKFDKANQKWCAIDIPHFNHVITRNATLRLQVSVGDVTDAVTLELLRWLEIGRNCVSMKMCGGGSIKLHCVWRPRPQNGVVFDRIVNHVDVTSLVTSPLPSAASEHSRT